VAHRWGSSTAPNPVLTARGSLDAAAVGRDKVGAKGNRSGASLPAHSDGPIPKGHDAKGHRGQPTHRAGVSSSYALAQALKPKVMDLIRYSYRYSLNTLYLLLNH